MRQLFICAGHRGRKTGAMGYIDEGAETIDLRDKIRTELIMRGVSSFADHNSDILSGVVNHVNLVTSKQDICIDIHFNAFNGTAKGSEILVRNKASDIEQELADKLLVATCKTLGTKNRGVKRETQGQHSRLAMLSDVKCNSVVLEVCFCDNKEDADKYNRHKEELVKSYADILEKFVKE